MALYVIHLYGQKGAIKACNAVVVCHRDDATEEEVFALVRNDRTFGQQCYEVTSMSIAQKVTQPRVLYALPYGMRHLPNP